MGYNGPTPRWVAIGETVRKELPFSEVCVHMRVAEKEFNVRIVGTSEGQSPMAQLVNEDGSDFSFPITMNEAGFYYDGNQDSGWFYYVQKQEA